MENFFNNFEEKKEKKKKEFNIDEIINKLLEAKSYKVNQEVPLIEAEIRCASITTKMSAEDIFNEAYKNVRGEYIG